MSPQNVRNLDRSPCQIGTETEIIFNTGMTIWQTTRITERVCLLLLGTAKGDLRLGVSLVSSTWSFATNCQPELRYVTASPSRNLNLTWSSSLNWTRKRSARISGWILEAQNYVTYWKAASDRDRRRAVTRTLETASDAVIIMIILSSWSDDHSAPSHESWFKVLSAFKFPPDLIPPAGSVVSHDYRSEELSSIKGETEQSR